MSKLKLGAIEDDKPVRLAVELPATAVAYRRAYLYLAHHGANTCTETDPHCGVCPLVPECPEGRKRLSIAD